MGRIRRDDPDSSIGFLISDVARLLRRVYDRRVEPLGLTRAQWRVLVHLHRREGVSQTALAGGTVPIDAGLSRGAVQRVVADPMGLSLPEAAFGIHLVANATMVRAIKGVTTYRGRDPRDFSIIAFGGNGGVHGAGIARSLEIRRVIVPPAAGVFSAVGLLVAVPTPC